MARAGKNRASLWRRLMWLGAGLAGLGVVVVAAFALWTQHQFQEPFLRTWSRALGPELAWQRAKYPSIDWAFAIPAALMMEDDRRSFSLVESAGEEAFPLSDHVGPRAVAGPLPVRYTAEGVPLPVLRAEAEGEAFEGVIESLPSASAIPVSSDKELAAA